MRGVVSRPPGGIPVLLYRPGSRVPIQSHTGMGQLTPADGPVRLRGQLMVPGELPARPTAPRAATAAPAAQPAPVTPAQPVLTEAMILQAFRDTPFARPTASVQPVGGRTLVTLDTYVELLWDPAGFEPGEINTVSILGHAVAIRPEGVSYTFNFGDGTTIGPTPSRGGPYPSGDVKHPYTKPGQYSITITATYSGAYSVDGGPWTPVAATVTVDGPPEPIDVRTSRNELLANPSS